MIWNGAPALMMSEPELDGEAAVVHRAVGEVPVALLDRAGRPARDAVGERRVREVGQEPVRGLGAGEVAAGRCERRAVAGPGVVGAPGVGVAAGRGLGRRGRLLLRRDAPGAAAGLPLRADAAALLAHEALLAALRLRRRRRRRESAGLRHRSRAAARTASASAGSVSRATRRSMERDAIALRGPGHGPRVTTTVCARWR